MLQLLRSNSLVLRPLIDVFGVQTYGYGTASERHFVVRVSPRVEWPERIHRVLSQRVSPEEAKRIVDAVGPHVQPISYQPDYYLDFSRIDWRKPVIRDFAEVVLGHLAPGYRPPVPLVFNAYNAESMVTVETNIDFAEAARFAANAEEPRSKLSAANVLGGLSALYGRLNRDAQGDGERLARRDEIDTNRGLLGALLANEPLDPRVPEFQEVTLGAGHAVAEAIDGGQRTFAEFMAVLERASRFRAWIAERAPSSNLVAAYHQQVTADTWIERLPGKTARWLFLQAAIETIGATLPGVPGHALGVALGFVDTFLVDRWIRGWRPSYFVNARLKPFVDSLR